jgi:valyl-tRNA synthetase
MSSLEKHWNKEMEKEIYEDWKKERVYKFVKKKKVFSIDTPPPYVNAPIHIGQAATTVLMDMFARFHRMIGDSVLFPLGLDRNGLPIEVATEKKFNVRLNETSREKFIELCKKILEETSTQSVDSLLKLGISFNSWSAGSNIGDVYETDSPEYRALTQATFIDLWKKGLVYEDERINNYCPGCRTTIADAEIEYKDIESKFVDIKFKVKETNEEIIIGTTRPELICSCGMVIFHPDDERYKKLNGKTAITPIFEKKVLIKAHPSAEKEKGTGIAMMCSAGDQHDIRFFREQKLEPIISINEEGRMNKNAGFLEGLKVKEAREKIIDELKKRNLLVSEKKIKHRTPVCERSKDPIEFIAMKELYLKQTDFIDKIKKISNEINFYDPKSRQILTDWINSVSIDWPLSRRRYYATEIPLWYCKKCNKAVVPEKGRYYKPWREPAPIKRCSCGSTEFRGEERVFDTWFDSSSSPLYILKWKGKPVLCSLRPQGKEIVRTWLYYTLLKCYLLTGKPIFKDVWINHHIVDENGKKMSKSLGNVIDPHEIIEKYGAEPLRLWCAIEGNLDRTDFRCSFERIEGAGKTLAKLWNVAKFVSMFPQKEQKVLTETDKWVIAELDSIVDKARKDYEEYNFHEPATVLKNFIWETFASHYLELVKNRAYNQENKFSKEEQASANYTLHYCLKTMLKLLAPITPFITYRIYKDLYDDDVHFTEFPEKTKIKTKIKTDDLIKLNSDIWKAKKDAGLSLKSEIKGLVLTQRLKAMEKDVVATHNAKKISYGKEIKIEL